MIPHRTVIIAISTQKFKITMYKPQVNNFVYICKTRAKNIIFLIIFALLIFSSSLITTIILLHIPQHAMAQIIIRPDQTLTTTSSTFLTYVSPVLGPRIQHPSNHTFVRESLHAFSVIPARYEHVPIWKTHGRYRKQMRRGYSKLLYNQRNNFWFIRFMKDM